MFQIELQSHFSAAHAITIGGVREPLHGHDWHVTAVIQARTLDDEGLLLDFHAVKHALDEILAAFHNRNLNEVAPFTELNPTAENVARYLASRLAAAVNRMGGPLPPERQPKLVSLRVTEAVGCAAIWRAD